MQSIDIVKKPLKSTYKKDLLKLFIPLSVHYGMFNCLNGGVDHCIFAPTSKNLFYYFKDHEVEVQSGDGSKGIRNLGCFWFHLGMIKKGYFALGKEKNDYISLNDFLDSKFSDLESKIQIKAHYKADFNGAWNNLKWHFYKDIKYMKDFLNLK